MNPVDMARREVERALRGVRAAFRGVLHSLVAATKVQRARVQGLAGEDLPEVEVMQHFGFTSWIPAGADLVLLPVGGKTAQAILVASEHGAYRIVLGAEGEVAIYNQWGDRVHLKADRSILLQAAVKVDIVSPQANFSGDVSVAGTLTAAVNVFGGGKSLATHTHGGVEPGGGTTGGPS